jgi:hypothetical protein
LILKRAPLILEPVGNTNDCAIAANPAPSLSNTG